MKQKMPVIKQIYWPSLIPQIVIIGILLIAVHFTFPGLGIPECMILAALIQYGFCRVMRAIFARAHISGMKAYQRGDFVTAISFFEKSREYFRNRPLMDKWRAALMSSSSPNSYQTLALLNTAFCRSQLGQGEEAIRLYELVLQNYPECTLARISLNMLKSTIPQERKLESI